MDLSPLDGMVDKADVIADGTAKAMYNDRTCCYYVRNKNGSAVKAILLADGGVYGTDYVVINEENHTGSFVFLDPPNHSNIESILYNDDGTILEGAWSTIEATKARLESG